MRISRHALTSLTSLTALALPIALFGCASNDASPDVPASLDGGSPGQDAFDGALPCDVAHVLGARCQTCHAATPVYGAPMPLVTLADLHAASKSAPGTPVFAQVRARIHDGARPMPPPPNAPLDAADRDLLDAWIARGAPAGDDARCAAPPLPDGDAGAIDAAAPSSGCTPDLHIAPTSAFQVGPGEVYACYGFDVPTKGKRHVTEIRMHVGDPRVVHHALLMTSPFGSSGTPTPCSAAGAIAAPMLYAWGPGGPPLVLPEAAGFPQDETTHYSVQIHYFNTTGEGAVLDKTGFDLCTTDQLRPNDADVIAFGSQSIFVPARGTGEVTSCYTAPAGLDGRHLFAAFPHMHKLGTSITTELLPGGKGAPVDLGTVPSWDFANQPWLPVDATVHTGDVVKAHCAWKNPGALPAGFGQSTNDEMCYSFTAYYPKMDLSFGWSGPAATSGGCQ